MRTSTDTPGDKPAKNTGNAAETPVQVWFVVEKNGATIGDAHHAKGKRMQLPKPQAEEARDQGLGTIDGVAG